jgi:hypothetical protein
MFAGLTAAADGDGVRGGVVVGDPDDGGVVSGAGLVAEAQATTIRPTTIVVATGSSEARISVSSGRCVWV